jgi:hypothetical protein
MARTVHADIVTALAADNVQPFYAVNLEFDTPVYYWTGTGELASSANSNSVTYQGAQDLLQISGLDETAELRANGATITLSGVPSTLLSLALTTLYHGRKAKIFFGVKGVSNLVEVFSGYMDKMTVAESPESATITVHVESKLVDLDRVRVRRYTHESHKSRYSNDTFFSFMADMQDKQINWGKPD